MKKVTCVLLALLIAIFLVACNDDGKKDDPTQTGVPGTDGIETPIIDLE